MATQPPYGVAARTLRALFWAYGSYVGARVLSLVATTVLARLLGPSEFGLVAIALIAIVFLDLMSGLGVGEALVVVDEREVAEKAETVFAIYAVVGLVSAAVLAALGPVMASFFDQPQLVQLMPVLGLTFLLRGLAGTHAALAQKRLDFRTRAMADLGDATARGCVGVVLALLGAGVWSLVLGYVAGGVAWAFLLWLLVPWRPRFRPRREHLRGLLRFGGVLTAVGLMSAIVSQVGYVAVGRVLGAVQLGFYTIAVRLPELLILGIAYVAGRVLFPAFATLHAGDVPRAVLTSFRYTAIVTLPLAVTLGVFAEPIATALLGEKWQPSIGVMQVLCIWVGIGTLDQVCGSAFKGRSRVDIILFLEIPQAVALVIGMLAVVHRGIMAVAWVQTGVAMCALAAAVVIAERVFDLGWRAVIEAFRPAVIAAGSLLVMDIAIERTVADPWTALAVGVGGGAVVYLGLVAVLAPETVRMARKALQRARNPSERTAAHVDPE